MMGLKSQNGKLLAHNGHLCNTCCSRYKCDPDNHVCSQTEEELGNPNVYASLSECMDECGEPCETGGCDFTVQFYYLEAWGGHQCDRAEFDAYCGSRLLGAVNLNNAEDGGSRYSSDFAITIADFIAATCSYTFSLVCKLGGGCHSGIAGLKFSTGLDLPAMSGDTWGVSANDICLGEQLTDLERRALRTKYARQALPKLSPREIHARTEICKLCEYSINNGYGCEIPQFKIKKCAHPRGGCFGKWRTWPDSKCPANPPKW